jgi:hypothetical protein
MAVVFKVQRNEYDITPVKIRLIVTQGSAQRLDRLRSSIVIWLQAEASQELALHSDKRFHAGFQEEEEVFIARLIRKEVSFAVIPVRCTNLLTNWSRWAVPATSKLMVVAMFVFLWLTHRRSGFQVRNHAAGYLNVKKSQCSRDLWVRDYLRQEFAPT